MDTKQRVFAFANGRGLSRPASDVHSPRIDTLTRIWLLLIISLRWLSASNRMFCGMRPTSDFQKLLPESLERPNLSRGAGPTYQRPHKRMEQVLGKF